MKDKLLCSICKQDAKRKGGRTIEDVGLDIPGYKKEPRNYCKYNATTTTCGIRLVMDFLGTNEYNT